MIFTCTQAGNGKDHWQDRHPRQAQALDTSGANTISIRNARLIQQLINLVYYVYYPSVSKIHSFDMFSLRGGLAFVCTHLKSQSYSNTCLVLSLVAPFSASPVDGHVRDVLRHQEL